MTRRLMRYMRREDMTMRYFDYNAESDTEELMFLIGKLESFAAFVDSHEDIDIDKKTCAALLGFELKENK